MTHEICPSKQIDRRGQTGTSLPPAKWPVELVLISNKEGRDQFACMERITRFLAPALCGTCQMSEEQLTLFPNSHTRG